MSRMTLTPFHEIAVDALKMREHRSPLTRNHLPKHARFQAPRRHTRKLPPKPSTTRDARAISLTMPTWIRNFKAASTAPFTDPVQRVAARFASRANHARPDPALPPAHDRHRPLL